jgi:hypothetical protein
MMRVALMVVVTALGVTLLILAAIAANVWLLDWFLSHCSCESAVPR